MRPLNMASSASRQERCAVETDTGETLTFVP